MLNRDIEIFRVVMTSGSTTRAAKVPGLSQPAVSVPVGGLEYMLFARYFVVMALSAVIR